jgi:hypothetical protein
MYFVSSVLILSYQKEKAQAFTPNLSHPRYQEPAWIEEPIDRRDKTYDRLIDEVLRKWKGRRYDVTFLKTFRDRFEKNPSTETAIQQSAAIAGFSGRYEGWTCVYYDLRLRNKPPSREYWDLVQYWPKNSSYALRKLRTVHYGLIGGNIHLGHLSYTKLLKSEPKDPLAMISEISCRITLRGGFGMKQETAKAVSDFSIAKSLFQEKARTNYLQVAYQLAIELYGKTKMPEYRDEIRRLGALLVSIHSGNIVESKIVPDIKKYLENLK